MARLFDEPGSPPYWLRLREAQKAIDGKIAELLRPLDLDAELLLVAYAIDSTDGGTFGDVAKLVELDEAALQRSVRALQLRGLVTRAKPKEAAETAELRFTTEGRRRVLRAHTALTRFDERLARWLGGHADRLAEGLDRIGAFPDLSA